MNRLLIIVLLCCTTRLSTAQAEFDPGRAAFAVGLNNEIYGYREFASYVMPADRIVIRILGDADAVYELAVSAGRLERTAPRRFVWIAPEEPGRVALTATSSAGDAIDLHVFVLVPARRARAGVLNGYQIGSYPKAGRDDPGYAPPSGYLEVREADLGTPVSPHFVLGQFVSDRGDAYPKYVVLKERLLLKLEALLERVNRDFPTDSFGVLSGYRTPAHNREIGGSEFSRHLYGGAAAIIVDRDPRDGIMDDLDGDGEITRNDAVVLFRMADELFRAPELDYLRGGLAAYGPTARRGPYLHIDARGYRARWKTDEDRQQLRSPRQPRYPTDFPRPR